MGAVAILDADPELADGLTAGDRELAVRHLVAPAVDLPVGEWAAAEMGRHSTGALGVLVLRGLLTRSVTLAGRTTGEIVGTGDVLRPWETEESIPPVPFDVSWMVLVPTRIAILDRRFVSSACRWPSVLGEIAYRSVNRSRSLGLQLALGQVPRVDGRLLLLFWRLAERWGRMTPDGMVVPLRLTHETLASLVAARRPSVTSALGRLNRGGLLQRSGPGWLLDRSVEDRMGEFVAGQDTRASAASASSAPIS